MCASAFFVKATRTASGCGCGQTARSFVYVALTDTPSQAVEAVRALVSAGTELTAPGDALSPMAARAMGLRPGQARLV